MISYSLLYCKKSGVWYKSYYSNDLLPKSIEISGLHIIRSKKCYLQKLKFCSLRLWYAKQWLCWWYYIYYIVHSQHDMKWFADLYCWELFGVSQLKYLKYPNVYAKDLSILLLNCRWLGSVGPPLPGLLVSENHEYILTSYFRYFNCLKFK